MMKKSLLLASLFVISAPLCANEDKIKLEQTFNAMEQKLNTELKSENINPVIFQNLGMTSYIVIMSLAAKESEKSGRQEISDEDLSKGIKTYTAFCKKAMMDVLPAK